jgi:hypothetical protein
MATIHPLNPARKWDTDMTDLPDPLTPAECDLRDYEWMPLDINRLLTSETWILGSADECKAALTLWCEAWRQVPAGSLPFDDRMLAFLSRAGDLWPKVRDGVLRSWVRCADGRIYHPVVAEKALEAWEMKRRQRERTRAATEARKSRSARAPVDVPPPAPARDDDDTSTVTSDDTSTLRSTLRSPPDQTRPDQNGEEKNQSSLRSDCAASRPDATTDEAMLEAVPPGQMDIRTMLWRIGLPLLRRMTGKSDPQARRMIGKWLRDLDDDCRLLGQLIVEASDTRPVDPVAWISRAVETRSRRGGTKTKLTRQQEAAIQAGLDPFTFQPTAGDGLPQ